MQSYRFEASFVIDAIRLERQGAEREAERVMMDASHHAYPLRGMADLMHMQAKVIAPQMTDEQTKAFVNCMNNAMRRFQSNFQESLHRIACEKESTSA